MIGYKTTKPSLSGGQGRARVFPCQNTALAARSRTQPRPPYAQWASPSLGASGLSDDRLECYVGSFEFFVLENVDTALQILSQMPLDGGSNTEQAGLRVDLAVLLAQLHVHLAEKTRKVLLADRLEIAFDLLLLKILL